MLDVPCKPTIPDENADPLGRDDENLKATKYYENPL